MTPETLARYEKAQSVTVTEDVDDTLQVVPLPKNSGEAWKKARQFKIGILIGRDYSNGTDIHYSKIIKIIKVHVWNLWGSSNPNEPSTHYEIVTQNVAGERDRQCWNNYYLLNIVLREAQAAKEDADKRLLQIADAILKLESV